MSLFPGFLGFAFVFLHLSAFEAHSAPGLILEPVERQLALSMARRQLPPPPKDVSNRYSDDPRAASLGKRFFSDPLFSGRLTDGDNDGGPGTLGKKGDSGKVACASCHLPAAGFVDARSRGDSISLGAGWGRRRAPALLDVAQSKLLMWDGRKDSLHSQVFSVLESPVEMNSARLFVAQRIVRAYKKEYEEIFGPLPPLLDPAVFPQLTADKMGCKPKNVDPLPTCDGTRHGLPGDGAEFDRLSLQRQREVTRVVVNFGKALAAYERTLTCGVGRFDDWVLGDRNALTPSEQRGFRLFAGNGRCFVCHSGPFFSDEKFHNIGLVPQRVAAVFIDSNDFGASVGLSELLVDPLNVRGEFSDGDDGRIPKDPRPEMSGAFKTPRLRCMKDRRSFMHTGHLHSLLDVVRFFNRGGDYPAYLGRSEIKPLNFTPLEMEDLVHFLESLQGKKPSR